MDKFIPLAIAGTTIFVVAFINIKIKFAKSEQEAIEFLKSTIVRILTVVVNILSFFYMFYFLFAGGSVTRVQIFTLVLVVFSIAMQLSLRMDKNIFQALAKSDKDLLKILKESIKK